MPVDFPSEKGNENTFQFIADSCDHLKSITNGLLAMDRNKQ